MGPAYRVRMRGAQTSEAHDAELSVGSVRYRVLDRAEKAATRLCREHDLKADIYDAHGSLVLRVDASGYRAP